MNNLTTTHEKVTFLKGVFGSGRLMNDGINFHVSCPSCGNGKKKKFVIRLDNDLCHCFVCGLKSKNLVPILKKYADPSDLQKYISAFYKGEMATGEIETDSEKLRLPEKFRLLASSLYDDDPDIKSVIKYVLSRGLTIRDLWYYKIGATTVGGDRRRAIIPSFDTSGNLNFYTGRDIDGDRFPRYLNSAVDKKLVVFNEINIDWNEELTLVEGPFDLMKCNDNATCLLGSGLARDSLLFNKIVENKTPVVLALDPDMKAKTMSLAKRLHEFDIQVRILKTDGFEDVGAMSKRQFLERKMSATSWLPFDNLKFKISNLATGSII